MQDTGTLFRTLVTVDEGPRGLCGGGADILGWVGTGESVWKGLLTCTRFRKSSMQLLSFPFLIFLC